MSMEKTTPEQLAACLDELWSPRIIGELDDYYIKVAKVQGVFDWHSHTDQDELFLILRGSMKIEMEDQVIPLSKGELFVVPKGCRHRPVADEECLILLIENKTTLHTGETDSELTRSIAEQLGGRPTAQA